MPCYKLHLIIFGKKKYMYINTICTSVRWAKKPQTPKQTKKPRRLSYHHEMTKEPLEQATFAQSSLNVNLS